MLNLQEYLIEYFVKELKTAYYKTYGILEPEYGEIAAWTGRLALENLANSDSLYHNVEHTMMVTSVGQAILQGKHLCEGGVTPKDWLHFTIALLCHDIGYARGVCRADRNDMIATGIGDSAVMLSNSGTDAALTPYHIDRSKLFVRERFGKNLLVEVNTDIITSYIEITRSPHPNTEFYKDTRGLPGLLRAADYIGQLGDPNYLRKIPALFYEFEETGANTETGFTTPGDMRKNYAKFYWNVVSPYIQDALYYLHVTHEGKQWIANLHSHVFDVEHFDLN